MAHSALQMLSRPRTPADCIDGPRPCPWVGCRFHTLVASVRNVKGSVRVCATPGAGGPNRPLGEWTDTELAEALERLPHTCALDFAEEHDGATLQEVGDALGLTRERVRQIEETAAFKLKRAGRAAHWGTE